MSQSQELQNSKTDLISTKDVDLKGRKVISAGNAINPQDYVPLSQVQGMIADAIKAAVSDSKSPLQNGSLILSSLSPSKPVKTNAGKKLISALIDFATDIIGLLTVPFGGTGAVTFTANSVLLGNGTGAIQTQAGVTGALTLTVTTGAIGPFVTGVTLTANNFTKGVRST